MKLRTMTNLLVTLGLAASAPALASTGEVLDAVPEDPRVSVEIPLEGPLRVEGAELVRVNELLEARTEFAAADFRLREVVLVARSEAETAGEAELLVMEWRSGEFEIPPAAEEEWYEVRLPAPEEDLAGAWLLDLIGDVTVDMLVAVLEPRPAAADHSALRPRTVYRVADSQPARVITRWVPSPTYYHVYHYHDGWPYRYFRGAWRYDLVYRHFRVHSVRGHRHHRKLRRVHPRLRVLHAGRTARRGHRARDFVQRDEARRHQRATRDSRHARRTANRPPVAAGASRRAPDARRDVARPLPRTRDFARRATSRRNGDASPAVRGGARSAEVPRAAAPIPPNAGASTRGGTRAAQVPRAAPRIPPNAGASTRASTQRARRSPPPRRAEPRQRATAIADSPPPRVRPNRRAQPAQATRPSRVVDPRRATQSPPRQRREIARVPSRPPNVVRRDVARPPAPARSVTPRHAPARPQAPARAHRAPQPAARTAPPDQTEARRSRQPSRRHRPERN